MKKIALITHIADPDGAWPIILAKLVFGEVEIISCEVLEVDEHLRDFLKRKEEFERIYIVDVNMSEEFAAQLYQTEEANIVEVYDHHVSRLPMNQYPFEHVVVEENGKKECGTTLFHRHLLEISDNPVLRKNSLKTMIEYVRQGDTFDFVEETKEKALSFGILYGLYGREKYIEHFLEFVQEKEEFSFEETEKELVDIENERCKRYLEEKLKHVKKANIEGVPVGIVFAENYRSALGHKMAEEMPDIDIAIVINIDRSVSYRASKENIDVNVLAVPKGGGGHQHAGGSPLPKDIQKHIVEEIFDTVIWEDEHAS